MEGWGGGVEGWRGKEWRVEGWRKISEGERRSGD